MYQENYILELKDKNGSSCSAENSYVSIEKFDNEYQILNERKHIKEKDNFK